MLITAETQSVIDQEIATLCSGVLHRMARPNGQYPSFLEQAYIAGKLASDLGPDRLRTMSAAAIQTYVKKNRVFKSSVDEAKLRAKMNTTEKWAAAMQDRLTQKVRVAIARADTVWAGELARRQSDGELRKGLWDEIKDSALGDLYDSVAKIMDSFMGWVDSFVQTELAGWFQEGQVAELSLGTLVYKIPRENACKYCLDLHIDEKGDFAVYQLSEVAGNTNVGLPAAEWEFTIGPVHPHCYCILYTVDERDPDQPVPRAEENTAPA